MGVSAMARSITKMVLADINIMARIFNAIAVIWTFITLAIGGVVVVPLAVSLIRGVLP